MNFKISGINAVNAPKIALNCAKKLNFQGRADIVSFSDVAKERNQILSDLAKIGIDKDKALEFIQEYYKTPAYHELINGVDDGLGESPLPAHYVEIERNLTPTEAILYQAYDMGSYYVQHGDWGFPDMPTTTIKALKYDLGSADFLPIDLAQNIDDDIDIVLSGMIIKGKLDKETAKKTAKYYNVALDNFSNRKNLKEAEYTAYLISQNLDKLNCLTSDEKDEDNNLLSGFSRPLTDEEAVILITNDYIPSDKASINSYIELKKEFGYSLFDMSLKDLWGKTVEDINNARKITKSPAKFKIESFEDAVKCVQYRLGDKYSEFFEDILGLDAEKFYKRYPAKAIQFDAMGSFKSDRELRQKNIQVLNNTSEELLNKMTSGQRDKRGHFALLKTLFAAKDLEERILILEKYKDENPQLFDSMTKQAVMDYLTDSEFYSKTQDSINMFLNTLQGNETDENPKSAEIIKFPTGQE